jgi:hypothetical protein
LETVPLSVHNVRGKVARPAIIAAAAAKILSNPVSRAQHAMERGLLHVGFVNREAISLAPRARDEGERHARHVKLQEKSLKRLK